jgi:5-methylcytosine-specific restriction endonuclease McrBC GTP-binding regulatory subunit McrB
VDNPDINAYIRNQNVISQEKPDHCSKVAGSGEDANPRLYKSVDIESENVNVTWKEKNGNGFTPKPKHLHFSANTAIRLPPNLSIYATMNISDQNVFTLDNAFQRRWNMELVPNICKWNDEDHKNQAKSKIGDTDIRWETFRKAINSEISDGDFFNADDKQLGLFFIEAEGDKIDGKKFANKVLKYLWADVFKRDTGKIFKSENLSKVVEDFTGTDAFDKVFADEFVQSLKSTNDEIKNHE